MSCEIEDFVDRSCLQRCVKLTYVCRIANDMGTRGKCMHKKQKKHYQV